MSQTETLLLVVLGFSLATLIGLFIGRLMWAAALKLGARRMQKQVPSTLVGLQTERDRLRAEYAMLSQRLGLRLEAARLKMAEQMAEVSRHRNRLETLEAERAAAEGVTVGLRAEVMALTAQLEDARTVQAELQSVIAEKQAALDLARRMPGSGPPHPLHPAPGESVLADADPERRLRERIERLNQMAHHVARERAEPHFSDLPDAAPPTEPAEIDAVLAQRLDEAERETADLHQELEQLDAEWAKRLEGAAGETGNPQAAPAPDAGSPAAVANVISLANRIRELRKGLSS